MTAAPKAVAPRAGRMSRAPPAEEDMEVMLMQGVQLKRAVGTRADELPNSRPYGRYLCNSAPREEGGGA